jgi:hypothetical protein
MANSFGLILNHSQAYQTKINRKYYLQLGNEKPFHFYLNAIKVYVDLTMA